MSAYTATATGDFNVADQWGGAGVPGIGDTATDTGGYTLTLSANTTMGTSPATASTVLTVGSGSIVVGGYTFDVRGDIQYNTAGQITVGAGGRLRLDNVPDGVTYRHKIGSAHNQTTSRLEVTGSSGSPATLDYSPAGTTGTGSIIANSVIGGGHARVQYATVTLSAIYFYPYNNTGWDYYWKNCTFTGSAGPAYVTGFMGANSDVDILDNTFTGTTSTYCFDLYGYTTLTGGHVNILRNDFDKAIRTGVPRQWVVEDNLLRDGIATNGSWNTNWGSFARNVWVKDDVNEVGCYGGQTDTYVVGTFGGANMHCFTLSSGWTGAAVFTGLIFDLDPSDSAGDLIMVQTSGTAARTLAVTYCLALPRRSAVAPAGMLVSSQAPASGTTVTVEHNTAIAAGTSGEIGGVVRVGETQSGYADMFDSVQSNIGWGVVDAYGIIWQIDSPGPADGMFTVADFNCGYDVTGGAPFSDNYEPTSAKFGSAPGGNDVNVNPQFADTTRNIVTWDTAQGSGTGTVTAALNYISADIVTRIAALTAWVRAGYAPGNISVKDAGHDGVTIGAVEYAAPTVADAVTSYNLLLLGVG